MGALAMGRTGDRATQRMGDCHEVANSKDIKFEVTWCRFCGQLAGSAFVPEGRSDSSLAVYCQEYVEERTRPVGYGMIGAEGTLYHLDRSTC